MTCPQMEETLDSVINQLNELDVRTNKQFKHFINQNPALVQKFIRMLMETVLKLSRILEEIEKD